MFAALKSKVSRSQPSSARPSSREQPSTARSEAEDAGAAAVSSAASGGAEANAATGSPIVAGAASLRSNRRSFGSSSAPQLAPLPLAGGLGAGSAQDLRKRRPGESPPQSGRSSEASLEVISTGSLGVGGIGGGAGSSISGPYPSTSKGAAAGAPACSTPPKLPKGKLEASRSAGALLQPQASPSGSPSGSPGTTPRTPRVLEVTVEGQEASVPSASWIEGGALLEVPIGQAQATVKVKAGVSGKHGMHVVLRVALSPVANEAPPSLRLPRSKEALSVWSSVKVRGSEECDLGRLPTRSSGSPRIPKPGDCRHEWTEPEALGLGAVPVDIGPEVPLDDALALGSSEACRATLRCRLRLRATATCELRGEGGQATLRLEVEGELSVLPRFHSVGRTAVAALYREARAGFNGGDEALALQRCERALALSATLPASGQAPRETADTLHLLGVLHLRHRAPQLAVKCLERALAIRVQQQQRLAAGGGGAEGASLGALSARSSAASAAATPRTARSTICGGSGETASLVGTLNALGSAHTAAGMHEEAYKCHLRAVALLEAASSPAAAAAAAAAAGSGAAAPTSRTKGDEAALGAALHCLGSAGRVLGKHEEAKRCYERALELRERSLGAESALTAATLNNLGAVLQQTMRYQEAVGCYQRALAIQGKCYGQEHPVSASTLGNLACAHSQLGEHRQAIDCHSRALAIQEQLCGSEHADVATTMHNLGNALAAAGHGHDAARCHWRALGIWSRTVGPAHPDVAATLHSLGNVYRGLRETEAARQCFAGALRIREATLGPTHTETARTRHCAALVGCSLGDRPAAAQELQAAVDSLIGGLGAQHLWTLQARSDLESLRRVTAT